MMARVVRACMLVMLAVIAVRPVMAQDCGARALEWHEAYENGRRALSRGRPVDAAQCFERAIQKRSDPGTNLLIYGTNVLPQYYPYVRLAEAQLLAGDPDAAAATLERSAEIGREPEAERQRVAAQIEEALAVLRPTPASTPEPTPAPTPEPTPAPTPEPTPAATPAPTPEPTPAPTATPTPTPAPRAEPRTPLRPVATPQVAREAPPTEPATASIEPDSTAEPLPGVLELRSEPGGAQVFLDGAPIGMTREGTESFTHEVSPGPHEVRLVLDDHRDAIAILDFASGERVRVRERLLPRSPEPSDSNTLSIVIALAIGAGLFLVGWAWRRLLVASPATLEDVETRAQPSGDLTPTSELPARFGSYTLVSRLGRGGMASVYRAERAGEAAVALKRPQESFLGEEQFIERFLREAELGRALNHPNIIRIFDRGEVGGVPYFTMQLLEGTTLWHALRSQGRFDPAEAARTIVQVAEGLDFAHSKGVVHRDLKPSNIWLRPDGRVVVMDFGIARARRFEGMTTTGAFLGTPEYIAPEVVDGETAGAASDMYALGVIFYELVTGRRPFVGDSAFAIFKQHRVAEPEHPSTLAPQLAPELERIILALLEKQPSSRPKSAEALVVSLRDYLNRS